MLRANSRQPSHDGSELTADNPVVKDNPVKRKNLSLCVSDRSGCSAVLILLMECRWRSAWGIFCFGSCNPLRSSRVSDRSRCSAVPILISSAQPSRYFLRVGS